MESAAKKELKGILDINSKPLVSKDFNHNSHSSIFDVTQTQVIKVNLVGYYLGTIMNLQNCDTFLQLLFSLIYN